MRLLVVLMMLFSEIAKADELSTCQLLKNGELVNEIMIISDVDGVIRNSTGGVADARVIQSIKSLLNHPGVNVTFISGTPVENDLTIEFWRRGHLPLNQVFGDVFAQEIQAKRVSIYGLLGTHLMKEDGSCQVVDVYSPEMAFEISKLLLHAFLKEVILSGTSFQKEIAHQLEDKLNSIIIDKNHTSHMTPLVFYEVIAPIHEHLDPHFKLVGNETLIESQTSNPPWTTIFSSNWLREEINQPQYITAHLPATQKHIATGLAKREGEGFNYLLVSKTHKGLAIEKHIEEKKKQFPNALIITIGDTQVDFPMHEHADVAFHVGLEKVLVDYPLSNCIMVRGDKGEDSQHVEGTLKVLKLIEKTLQVSTK